MWSWAGKVWRGSLLGRSHVPRCSPGVCDQFFTTKTLAALATIFFSSTPVEECEGVVRPPHVPVETPSPGERTAQGRAGGADADVDTVQGALRLQEEGMRQRMPEEVFLAQAEFTVLA